METCSDDLENEELLEGISDISFHKEMPHETDTLSTQTDITCSELECSKEIDIETITSTTQTDIIMSPLTVGDIIHLLHGLLCDMQFCYLLKII